MFAGSSARMSPNVAVVRIPPRRGSAFASGCAVAIGGARSFEQPSTLAASAISAPVEISGLLGIQRIAQAFSEEVEAEDAQEDRAAGRGRDPRRGRDVLLAFEEHEAPR